jgi:hypothetical protein
LNGTECYTAWMPLPMGQSYQLGSVLLTEFVNVPIELQGRRRNGREEV